MIDSGFIFNLYHCFIDDAYTGLNTKCGMNEM